MKCSAQKFLNKAIGNKGKPSTINTDKSVANTSGIMTSKKIKILRI